MKFVLLIATALLSLMVSASTPNSPTREDRELQMALKVINSAFIADAGGSVSAGDFKASAVELALALIGSRDDAPSNKALLSLLAYRLDGGLSEDFHCYALKRGRPLISEMKSLDIRKTVDRCRANVKNAALYKGVRDPSELQDRICFGGEKVSDAIRMYTQEIEQSKKCDPADF